MAGPDRSGHDQLHPVIEDTKGSRGDLRLVVGLQGRYAEAESIARSDLPPDEAASNVAYLKQMMSQAKAGKTLGGAAPSAS